MIIETKHDVGDSVFVMYQDRVTQGSVGGFYFNSRGIDRDDMIEISRSSNVPSSRYVESNSGITYKVALADKEIYFPEHRVFKTKEDLINSL